MNSWYKKEKYEEILVTLIRYGAKKTRLRNLNKRLGDKILWALEIGRLQSKEPLSKKRWAKRLEEKNKIWEIIKSCYETG